LLSPTRFFALDSSHLSNLARDWASADSSTRSLAKSFIADTFDLGWLPLISWHQLEELLQFEDEDAVDDRVRCLRAWPLMAWIRSSGPGPGTFFDVFRAEVQVAHENPELDVHGVRRLVREGIFDVGTGRDAVPSDLLTWRDMRLDLGERKRHARGVTAIAGWRVPSMDELPLSEWLKLPLREPGATKEMLQALRQALDIEVRVHGDKLIGDAERESIVGPFADDVVAGERYFRGPSGGEPPELHPMLQILSDAGLDLDQIDLTASVPAILDLLVFQKRLRGVASSVGVPWHILKRTVTHDRLPGVVIEDAIRVHRQTLPTRPGSDLNDTHLLRLAPYADMTFVDKRTMENVRRATAKVPNFGPLVGRVAKASSYPEVLRLLREV
jgi:hypothetical protein